MTIGTSCPLSYYNLSCNIVLTHRGEIDEDDYQGGLVAIIVAIAAVMYGARFLNNASNSKESTSTLIKNVEKVNELVLVNAGIQKVITKENNVKVPWTQYGIPFSERKSLLVLNYTAKFGIKKPVKISEKGDHSFEITVPKYEVIGFEMDKDNPYQLYDNSGALLSFATENIDTGQLVAKSLTSADHKEYLDGFKSQLYDSVKTYFTTIIKSIDPAAKVTFTLPE